MNEDLTRADGAIVCRELTALELLSLTKRVWSAIRILRIPPIPF